MIEFDGVSKRYPDGTAAVDTLSLIAPSGRTTVLVGPSGCGKTTSLNMVNRLVEPTSGRILIDGEDAASLDPVTLRRRIGYVIQQVGLFPHQTVLDNVITVPRLLGWRKAQARRRGYELLELVGLPTAAAQKYPSQLSGGQQQRVGVARALASDPPVMLMDEPFSAVDPLVRSALQDEFLRLQREVGKTILFVTHDMDEAVKLGDHVAVFRAGGTLAQFGTPEDLLHHPADDFVGRFVGKDRGYRRLSFLSARDLPLRELPTVRLGEPRPASLSWTLAVNSSKAPLGWLPPGDSNADVDLSHLQPLGATFTRSSSMRSALDAALTSPSGWAVCVDDAGAVAGGCTHADLAGELSPVGILEAAQ